MTSENEKTVHQQSITEDEDPLSIEEALEHAENAAKALIEHRAEVGTSVSWEMFDEEAIVVLAAEVRRLQASLQGRYEDIDVIHNQLRETIRVMSTNEGKLHAKIAELETKLARVEALPAQWRAWMCAED